MSTIVTRAGKGSALTHNEVDANFVNLNTDKIEAAQTVTLTNKTISLGSNTVSGTTAQFNTALTDGDFATLAGSETLTNKTISGSSNTLSNIGNASLTNSSVTIGSTSVSLGSTATTVAGLTLSSPTVSGGTINNASVGATTPSTGSFTSLTDSGNLTFTGTGNRITGDFSNATVANRVMFQTSTTNGGTTLGIMPNGTGTTANFASYGNSADPANSSVMFAGVSGGGTEVRLNSAISGTGTYLPMTFYTSGSEKLRIAADTTGTYKFGGTAPRITGDFSNATVANRVMFQTSTVNGSTVIGAIPNGTATDSNLQLWTSTDPTNSSVLAIAANSTVGEVRFNSNKFGTGTYLPMTFYTGGSERMRIDTSGNVGIGTALPNFNSSIGTVCHINNSNGSSWAINHYTTGATGSGATDGFIVGSLDSDAYVFNYESSPIVFGTASTERARIDSSGNLLVGTTSSSETTNGARIYGTDLRINSTKPESTNSASTFVVYSTGASAYRFYVGMGGTIFATSTSISAISDATLKENVRDLETGLTEVMALKPRRFDWKSGDAQNVAGFVAQEVEQVLPELVSDYVYNKDEEGNDIIKKSLKMGDILPTLVKAIQEQQAMIEELKAKVAALENK